VVIGISAPTWVVSWTGRSGLRYTAVCVVLGEDLTLLACCVFWFS
jgi:hypothetical protein